MVQYGSGGMDPCSCFPAIRRFFSAPMAGVTDYAFRTVCAQHGADVTVTEMVSSRALVYQDRKSRGLLRRNEELAGRGAQIFGNDPAMMAEARRSPSASAGATFWTSIWLPHAEDRQQRRRQRPHARHPAGRTHHPRRGGRRFCPRDRKDPPWLGPELPERRRAGPRGGGKRCSRHHGPRPHEGHALFRPRELAAPWRGRARRLHPRCSARNGDISDPEQLLRCRAHSGASLFMAGRAAFGDPWLFERLRAALRGKTPRHCRRSPTARGHGPAAIHALAREDKGEHIACLEARKHFAWYLRGVPHSGFYKEQISNISAFSDA